MARINLFSDLDRTLIYSHRIHLPEGKVVVERLEGKDQSFMTKAAFDYFCNNTWFQLVPVTTRTVEQVQRLFSFGKEIRCRYCLACNGGVLLIDGKPDDQWLSKTKLLAGQEIDEVNKAYYVLKNMVADEHIFLPSGMMTYASCDNPQEIAANIRDKLDCSHVLVYFDSHKVYCIPRSVNKGEAVHRFERCYGKATSVGAGDSAFDVPLLNAVDYAIAPASLGEHLTNRRKALLSDDLLLSDEICRFMDLMKNGFLR